MLIFPVKGIVNSLGNARGQSGGCGGEYTISGLLLRLFRLSLYGRLRLNQAILGDTVQIVSKSIAADIAKLGLVGKPTVSFQHVNHGQAIIGGVNYVAQLFLGNIASETIVHKIGNPGYILQVCGVVGSEQIMQRGCAAFDLVDKIVAVQVGIHIVVGEGVIHQIVHAQILFQNLLNLCFPIASGKLALSKAHQVTQVTSPATKIGRHLSIVVVAGHVQRAKHMPEIQHIAVGQLQIAHILQPASSGAVGGILLGNVLGESRIFSTCQYFPAIGKIAVYAGADIVNHQLYSIFPTIGLGKILSIAFQNQQVTEKGLPVAGRRLLRGNLLRESRDRHNA